MMKEREIKRERVTSLRVHDSYLVIQRAFVYKKIS